MVVASKDGGYGLNNGVDRLEIGVHLRHGFFFRRNLGKKGSKTIMNSPEGSKAVYASPSGSP